MFRNCLNVIARSVSIHTINGAKNKYIEVYDKISESKNKIYGEKEIITKNKGILIFKKPKRKNFKSFFDNKITKRARVKTEVICQPLEYTEKIEIKKLDNVPVAKAYE